jgi:hypothetical protein
MEELTQIIVCDGCNHPVNACGTNICPLCGHHLAYVQTATIDPSGETIEKSLEEIRGEQQGPAKIKQGE